MSETVHPIAQHCIPEEMNLQHVNGILFSISQTVCIFSALWKDSSMEGLSGCSGLQSHFRLISSRTSPISISG